MSTKEKEYETISAMRRAFSGLQTEIQEFTQASIVNEKKAMETARIRAQTMLDEYFDHMALGHRYARGEA